MTVKASKNVITPPKSTYRRLPITPFHGGLQKAKGKVDGFTEQIRETTLDECSYANGKSRGELSLFSSWITVRKSGSL
jgi:hypothetical protein